MSLIFDNKGPQSGNQYQRMTSDISGYLPETNDRDLAAKLKQIESRKGEFRDKFYEKHPLLVDLTLWCLEHKYSDRPKFKDLHFKIMQSKRENRKNFKHFRSNKNFKFPKIQLGGRKLSPSRRIESMRELSIQSHSDFQHKSIPSEPPNLTSVFLKKKESETVSQAREDFVVQAESKQSVQKLSFKSEVKQATRGSRVAQENQFFSENVDQTYVKPFDNDYSGDKLSSVKKKRTQQKIFDESQDIYYRELKNEGVINYHSLGTGPQGKLEMRSSQVGIPPSRRFIRASHK